MFSTVEQRLASMQTFLELTRQAAQVRPAPDVICWPETMFLGPALNLEAVEQYRAAGVKFRDGGIPFDQSYNDLTRLQGEIGIPMLIGATARDGDVIADLNHSGPLEHSRIYNSVVLLDLGRAQPERYDKVELMPFGEVIPYVWRWPALQQRLVDFGAAGMAFDLSPGTRAEGIRVPVARTEFGRPDVRIGTPICFEATRAGICRRLVRGEGGAGRAALLINFSNDGWFGWWDTGRRQHLLSGRWRCVELGVPMVRCVNTGVSAQIDPMGRVMGELMIDRASGEQKDGGVFSAAVPLDLDRSPTLFERVGLIPAYAVTVLGVAGMFVLWRRSRATAGAA